MAKTTTVTVTDDLDGSKNAEEVSFSFEGASWTIDLSAKNKAALEKALKPYMDAGAKVGGRRKSASSKSGRSDLADVRAWAKKNGHEVSERGRVPKAVLTAYDAAR
jgi:Lsr2